MNGATAKIPGGVLSIGINETSKPGLVKKHLSFRFETYLPVNYISFSLQIKLFL